jgi:ABC-2 type transport system permease protein
MMRGWRRLWLVARREWSQRVRTLAFRVATMISIVIVVAIILVSEMYGGGSESARTVGLVGTSSSELPTLLRGAGDQLDLALNTRAYSQEATGEAALRSGDVSVLLVDQTRLVWKAETDDRLRAAVTSAVGILERRRAVGDLGLTMQQANRLLQQPDLQSTSLDPATRERTARETLATIAVGLLLMALAFYCGFLLVGVVEEKSSRVVEVLLARVRPTELLAGKALGIGLVGLAQFALIGAAALVALALTDSTLVAETTPATVGWVVFWFVLGYAFYSVLYATAGSMVSRQEEAQSVQFPVTAILFVAYFVAMTSAEAPGGTTALIGSLLPPTAPLVMIVRIAHGGVPWWHIALSTTAMVVAVYAMVQLAGRLYSGAVLRFGRRVGLKEAWHGART